MSRDDPGHPLSGRHLFSAHTVRDESKPLRTIHVNRPRHHCQKLVNRDEGLAVARAAAAGNRAEITLRRAPG